MQDQLCLLLGGGIGDERYIVDPRACPYPCALVGPEDAEENLDPCCRSKPLKQVLSDYVIRASTATEKGFFTSEEPGLFLLNLNMPILAVGSMMSNFWKARLLRRWPSPGLETASCSRPLGVGQGLSPAVAGHTELAGQTLTPQAMDALVKTLMDCTSPFTCPHGRPTMVRYSVRQLESQFDRR